MAKHPLHVTIHIDGGSRGNPGPGAAAFVIRDAADGQTIRQAGIFLGKVTNNVAEYRGLLAGLRAAGELDAAGVEVVSDSELLVRQMTGRYRVKNEGLQPLYAQATKLAGGFDEFSIRHVRREKNKDADGLVNQALDSRCDVEDAASA